MDRYRLGGADPRAIPDCLDERQLDAALRTFNITPTRRRRAALACWLELYEPDGLVARIEFVCNDGGHAYVNGRTRRPPIEPDDRRGDPRRRLLR